MAEATDNRLLLLVERYERLHEEEQGIKQDKRDVVAEAKAVGYDGKTFRALIARRAMKPDDRAEADFLLAAYEAALGMDGAAAEAAIAETRPDLMQLAEALLAQELEGLEDPAQAALLVGHVLWLLSQRAEIKLMRDEEAARRKLAASEGFDAKQLQAVVRWLERAAKHGVEAMRLGEATFRQYRATFDQRPDQLGPVSGDDKLSALFQPKAEKPGRPSARNRSISEAEIWAKGGFGG